MLRMRSGEDQPTEDVYCIFKLRLAGPFPRPSHSQTQWNHILSAHSGDHHPRGRW